MSIIIWFYLWSIKNNMEDIRIKKGNVNWGKSEGEMIRDETVDSEEQTEGLEWRGMGRWVSLVVGIKEGMYCMELWVLYINNESWNTV